jgi:hypothetical protein
VSIGKEDLLKAAKAVRAAQAAREMDEATTEQLLAYVRLSPIWATLPNPPAPGEPIDDAQLEELLRNCRIAEALGIEC